MAMAARAMPDTRFNLVEVSVCVQRWSDRTFPSPHNRRDHLRRGEAP